MHENLTANIDQLNNIRFNVKKITLDIERNANISNLYFRQQQRTRRLPKFKSPFTLATFDAICSF